MQDLIRLREQLWNSWHESDDDSAKELMIRFAAETTQEIEKRIGEGVRVEIPDSDAYEVFRRESDLRRFLMQYGFPDMEYDDRYNVYRVPSFQDSRQAYIEAKAKTCEVWGSH